MGLEGKGWAPRPMHPTHPPPFQISIRHSGLYFIFGRIHCVHRCVLASVSSSFLHSFHPSFVCHKSFLPSVIPSFHLSLRLPFFVTLPSFFFLYFRHFLLTSFLPIIRPTVCSFFLSFFLPTVLSSFFLTS